MQHVGPLIHSRNELFYDQCTINNNNNCTDGKKKIKKINVHEK